MKNSLMIILSVLLITSCGQSEADSSKSEKINIDTIDIVNISSGVDSTIISKTPELTKPDINDDKKNRSGEILSNIDNYLLSKAQFTPPVTGEGITDAIVTLENTLPDITIQKILLEVSILTATNVKYRTDYYTLQNIEPGDIKRVKVPNSKLGTSIKSRVVKLKSDVLTNGEMILVAKK